MPTIMSDYDVLIVAQSPGGWAAAVTLAQAGRKVALLDQVRVDPSSMIPRGGVLLQVFPALEQKIKRDSQLFQVVAPGHRFSVPPGYNRFLSELGFEFPELKDELDPVLNRVQGSGRTTSDYFRIWGIERRRPDYRTLDGKLFENLSLWRHYQRVRHLTLAGVNQRFSRSSSLCRILESPGRFSSAAFWDEDAEGMGAFSAYYRQAFFPLFSTQEAKGGLVGLGEVMTVLRRIAREMKVEVLNPVAAGLPEDGNPGSGEGKWRFEFSTRRQIKKATAFHSWEKNGEGNKVLFRSLIWSGNGPGFLHSLSEKLRKARGAKLLSRHLETLEARYFLETLEIKVKAEVIPVGMEKRVFYIGENDQEPADENLVYLEVLPVQEAGPVNGAGGGVYPQENGNLLIRAAFFRSASKPASEVSSRVFRRVCGLVPFLEEFLVGEPVLKKKEESAEAGSPVWHHRRGLNRGKLAVPVGKAGIYFSGRELLPALGFEADLLSGLVTAWSLEKWLRKISK
ncbi:MAG: hypothetical protein PHE84_09435 [bacterium]|nr:hypothetical protein [bacterium]